MATREENLNMIREKLTQADKELDSLTDEQLDAIVGGKDYTYGNEPKFLVGEIVNVYIPISGFWNSVLYVLVAYDTSESFTGVITGYKQIDGKWVYDIMTSAGEEYEKIDERFLSVK